MQISTAFDDLDLTVGRAIDDAIAAVAAADFDHALDAIERALRASEAHPTFSQRGATEFQRLEQLALICELALKRDNRPIASIQALIVRVRALGQLRIH